jgi:RsiW-degrading membrane proteinase PrsW (M82 family)
MIALYAKSNDEPIDAMIYFITVALGFAAFESALFILDPLSKGAVIQSIISGNFRFMGAELIHVASSAFIGFAYGYTFYRGLACKWFALIVGLIAAIALHSIFNLTIISVNPDQVIQTISWFWGAIVILIILFEEVKAVRPKLI